MLSRVGRYREAQQVLDEGETQSISREATCTMAVGPGLSAALLAIERGDHARALRDIPSRR